MPIQIYTMLLGLEKKVNNKLSFVVSTWAPDTVADALTLSTPFPACTKPSLAHPISYRLSALFLNFDCNISMPVPQVDPH